MASVDRYDGSIARSTGKVIHEAFFGVLSAEPNRKQTSWFFRSDSDCSAQTRQTSSSRKTGRAAGRSSCPRSERSQAQPGLGVSREGATQQEPRFTRFDWELNPQDRPGLRGFDGWEQIAAFNAGRFPTSEKKGKNTKEMIYTEEKKKPRNKSEMNDQSFQLPARSADFSLDLDRSRSYRSLTFPQTGSFEAAFRWKRIRYTRVHL